MAKGDFILVNRSLLKWEWYSDLPVRVLFQHLMLTVNWAPGRFKGVTIAPGQVPTSVQAMASGSGLTVQQTKTAISKLKSTGEITCEATNHFTVVTLVNWAKWQSDQQAKQPASNQRSTGDQPSSNRRATTIEEEKEGNTERRKEGNTERAALVWPSWATDKARTAWEQWKAYKVERREGYKSIGENSAFSKFIKEYTNDGDFVNAIEHSMAHGWKGIFKPHNSPVLNINGGMTREEAEAEMTAIRIKNGRDPVMGRVDDEECSRALLIYRGVIKEPKAARA